MSKKISFKHALLCHDVINHYVDSYGHWPSVRQLAVRLDISKSLADVLLNGQLENPQLNTMLKICSWLRVHPGTYLDCEFPLKSIQ